MPNLKVDRVEAMTRAYAALASKQINPFPMLRAFPLDPDETYTAVAERLEPETDSSRPKTFRDRRDLFVDADLLHYLGADGDRYERTEEAEWLLNRTAWLAAHGVGEMELASDLKTLIGNTADNYADRVAAVTEYALDAAGQESVEAYFEQETREQLGVTGEPGYLPRLVADHYRWKRGDEVEKRFIQDINDMSGGCADISLQQVFQDKYTSPG